VAVFVSTDGYATRTFSSMQQMLTLFYTLLADITFLRVSAFWLDFFSLYRIAIRLLYTGIIYAVYLLSVV